MIILSTYKGNIESIALFSDKPDKLLTILKNAYGAGKRSTHYVNKYEWLPNDANTKLDYDSAYKEKMGLAVFTDLKLYNEQNKAQNEEYKSRINDL